MSAVFFSEKKLAGIVWWRLLLEAVCHLNGRCQSDIVGCRLVSFNGSRCWRQWVVLVP